MATPDFWKVTFTFDPDHHRAVYDAALALVPAERVDIIGMPRNELGDDGWGIIELAVRATGEEDARTRASETLEAILERAEVPGVSAILGVKSPIFGPQPHERLLQEAEQLVRDDRNELAVLRAQTAAELYGKTALGALFAGRLSPAWRKDSHRLVRPALSDPRSRSVFEAITLSRPEQQEWWSDYDVHLKRRRAIAHDGVSVTTQDAQASLRSVRAFIDYLQTVWAAAALPPPNHEDVS